MGADTRSEARNRAGPYTNKQSSSAYPAMKECAYDVLRSVRHYTAKFRGVMPYTDRFSLHRRKIGRSRESRTVDFINMADPGALRATPPTPAAVGTC